MFIRKSAFVQQGALFVLILTCAAPLKSMETNTTLFFEAIQTTNEASIDLYLQQGFPLDVQDSMNQTALHHAAHVGNLSLIERLLQAGVNPSVKDINGSTFLHTAALAGSDSAIANLLYQKYRDLFHRLIRSTNNMATLPSWLTDEDSRTLLHHAVLDNNTDLARALAFYSRVDDADSYGCAPLWYALEREHLEIADILIDHGATINLLHPDWHEPILFHLAGKGKTKTIEWLSKQGVDIHSRDKQGWSALFYASHEGHIQTMRWLILHGADIQAQSTANQTVAHVAASNNQLEALQEIGRQNETLLIRADANGLTPLNAAANNTECHSWLENINQALHSQNLFISMFAMMTALMEDEEEEPMPLSMGDGFLGMQYCNLIIDMAPLFDLRRDKSMIQVLQRFVPTQHLLQFATRHLFQTLMHSNTISLFYILAIGTENRHRADPESQQEWDEAVAMEVRVLCQMQRGSLALAIINRAWQSSQVILNHLIMIGSYAYQSGFDAYRTYFPLLPLLRDINWINRLRILPPNRPNLSSENSLTSAPIGFAQLPTEIIERIIYFLIMARFARNSS